MVDQIKKNIIAALERSAEEADFLFSVPVFLEKTKNIEYGHYVSNLPFAIASKYNKKPSEVGKKIIELLKPIENVVKFELVNNGFINFFLDNNVFNNYYQELLNKKNKIGQKKWDGRQYVIEIVSANPNGSLHVGHIRNGIVGDTLSNLLEYTGAKVLRSYLINDCGQQVKDVVNSVWVKYKFLLFGTNYQELANIKYNTTDVESCAKSLIKKKGNSLSFESLTENENFYEFMRSYVVDYFLNEIKKNLHDLNIEVNCWDSEKKLVSEDNLNLLLKKIQKNILLSDGCVWFKTSSFTDDKKNDVLIKQNGDHTYFAQDLIYHLHKLSFLNEEGKIINIFGTDHEWHMKRLQYFFQVLNMPTKLIFKQLELIRLVNKDKQNVMSKRNNTSLNLYELLEYMNYEEIRWFFVSKNDHLELAISVEKLKNKDYNNPVFYVLYGYARISQLLLKFGKPDVYMRTLDFSNLVLAEEKEIMSQLLYYSDTLEAASRDYQPHYICSYVHKLVNQFHAFYEKCEVLKCEDKQLQISRLALCNAVKYTLESALSILKITPKSKI